MAAIDLIIKGEGLEQFRRYAERLLGGDLTKIQKLAAWRFAQRAGKIVRQAYRDANFPISEATAERYKNPPTGADVVSSSGSLKRSGMMAKSVVVRKMPSGRGYWVQIDPAATYPDGKRVAQVAEWMETGYRFVMTATPARLAYLHALREAAGKPRDKSGTLKLGETLIAKKEGRPIWEPTYKKLRTLRHEYFRIVNRLLQHQAKVSAAP